MSKCLFIKDGKGCRCTVCGIWVSAKDCPRAFRNCGPLGTVAPAPEKLGDWTERQLKKIGVTPERYADAKKRFGLSPTCNCQERKEFLNRVSDWWRGVSQPENQ